MSLSVMAQVDRVVRGNCTPPPDDVAVAEAPNAQRQYHRLPAVSKGWDANRIYHQLVILFEFKGDSTYFKEEDPKAQYESLLNTTGFVHRKGVGCMADYFRVQSNGLFNVQFDIFGPYQVSGKSQPFDNPSENSKNYGRESMIEATKMFLAEEPQTDFSQYDWNNDGYVNQVIYIYAGVTGNQSSPLCYGHIWPNTSSFSSVTTPDGKLISNYTASAELWSNSTSCGIGTICHEYTHSLGLPDIYPTGSSSSLPFSVCDEWDLMDGGNFTNYGSCPPNYTALEKHLLGWLDYNELTEPTTIEDMKPLSEGGKAYVVKHTDNEYLLLENRQQRDWDKGTPGQGLVVYHVNYKAGKWSANTVNNTLNQPNFALVHADGLDYDAWTSLLYQWGKKSNYQNASFMNSWYLSSSPYPYVVDSLGVQNDSLTNNSVPSTKMYNNNSDGEELLSKPITNIRMSADGLVSFDFMGGTVTPVTAIRQHSDQQTTTCFDLNGLPCKEPRKHGLYMERKADGTVRKVLK